MLVIEQAMQHKLSGSWKSAYNTEFPVMAEDQPDRASSLASGLDEDGTSLVNGLLKTSSLGGLEQKIQELRAEKEAAESKSTNCPGGGGETDDQDSPIDFSVKRRTSFSGSFSDDSVASSSSPTSHMADFPNSASPLDADEQREQARLFMDRAMARQQQIEREFNNGPHTAAQNGGGDFFQRRDSPSPSRLEDVKPPQGGKSVMGPTPPLPPLMNGLGMFPGLPGNLLANGSAMNAFSQLAASAAFMDPRSKKTNRPFKAYPKEALQMPLGFFGLPGMNPALLQQGLESGLFGGANADDMMNVYNQQLQQLREKHLSSGKGSPPNVTIPPAGHKSPSHSNHGSQQQHPPSRHQSGSPSAPQPHSPPDVKPHHLSSSNLNHQLSASSAPSSTFSALATPSSPINHHSNGSSTTLVSSTSPSFANYNNSRKRPRSLPDEQKDAAYWERRRKNNDAAKRSRDARRAKEDEIAIRAALLEQENLKLRVEVAALKTETARLRCLLYNS